MSFDPKKLIIQRTEGPLSKSAPVRKSFEVAEVFPGSVAAAAGIAAGLRFLPSHAQANDPLYLKDKLQGGDTRSRFVDDVAKTDIELVTRGYPFGMALRRPLAALCNDLVQPGHEVGGFLDDVFERIHEGDDRVFDRLVRTIDGPVQSRLEALFDGLFGQLVDKTLTWRGKTLRMVKGVHYAMRSRPDRARRLMEAFAKDSAAAIDQTALYCYGFAHILEAEGAPDEDIDHWLEEAYQYCPSSRRIRQKIGQRSGVEPMEPERAYPRPFPLNYALVERDPLVAAHGGTPALVGLRAELSQLRDDQFLVVVTMSSYRANGYYSNLAHQLGVLRPLLGDHFPIMHVITNFQPGGRLRDEWLDGERFARDHGVTLRILLDPDHSVPDLLKADGAPCGVIVNKAGQILYQGTLNGERGYWLAMESIRSHTASNSGAE